ncbi:hypothetical protein [Fulvivirga marina]|nr:hypothetical protein [Fulvivirga marina]
MEPLSIYYYPYANFGKEQLQLLKVAALYFDKLYILDPSKANWSGIGQPDYERDVRTLESEGIIERISPEDVLHKYENLIQYSIEQDLKDQGFREICDHYSLGKWTLAIAKIPKELRDLPDYQPVDQSMRNLMSSVEGSYGETFDGTIPVYDEYREVQEGVREYRYADMPFAVGEAIMMNHALVGSLLHTSAVPITDDPVHSQILNYKIEQSKKIPQIRDIILDRHAQQSHAHASMAVQTLSDFQFEPIPQEMNIDDILKHREKYKGELNVLRDRLGKMAREINCQPWTKEFDDEVFHKLIPEVNKALEPTKAAWKSHLKTTGLLLGGASIVLSLFGAPLTPIALGIAGVSLVKDVGLGGFEILKDWQTGKKQNGFHYLIKLK